MANYGRVIVVCGPPGCGKGTQCKELGGFVHLSTGDVFREAIAERTELGVIAEEHVSAGRFVPDDIVIGLIKDRLSRTDAISSGVLLDGFPRTQAQAQALAEHVPVERVLLLQSSDDICIERILGRMVDPRNGRSYHAVHAPPPPALAARLVKRAYDVDESVIRKRLQIYHLQLGRILPYFRGRIQVVDASASVDVVQRRIAAVLKSAVPQGSSLPESTEEERGPKDVAPACTVCLDAPAEFLVIPCGHQCGCQACLQAIQGSSGSCPICRSPIENIVKVFQCGVVEEEMAAIVPEKNTGVLEGWDDDGWGGAAEGPTGSATAITVSAAPCEDVDESGGSALVAISVTVPEMPRRDPIDVCCVIDISGSMCQMASYEDESGQEKDDGFTILDVVKHAVKTVINMLEDGDRLSLVAFDDRADTVYDLASMTATGRAGAIRALEGLEPRNRTNIWAGLLAGMDTLSGAAPTYGEDRKKFVLLLTDGMPNVSPPHGHIAELRTYLEAHAGFRFQLNTFGFGYQSDSSLLLELAVEGRGTYAFIPDAKIVGTCFVNCVANAVSTVTQNADLHVMLKGGSTFTSSRLHALTAPPHTEAPWGRVVSLGTLQAGQSRDVIVPLAIPAGSEEYLDVVVVYTDEVRGEVRASARVSTRASSRDAVVAHCRAEAVSAILLSTEHADGGHGKKAAMAMLQSTGKIATFDALSDHDPRVCAIQSDITGRAAKALTTRARFHRWGKHYLRALGRSHQVQQCTNFMDPGLQLYGGDLFKALVDEGGEIFKSMPAPRPTVVDIPLSEIYAGRVAAPTAARPAQSSTTTARSGRRRSPSPPPRARAPSPDMSDYYAGAGGGCLSARSTVEVVCSEGVKTVSVALVRAGDRVVVSNGGTSTVVCTARIAAAPSTPLCTLPGGLEISPTHPIYLGRQWVKPAAVCKPQLRTVNYLYNFVLEDTHVLVANGIECVTWGHGLENPPVHHAFYGNMTRIVKALTPLGFAEGSVTVSKFLRDADGHVESFA